MARVDGSDGDTFGKQCLRNGLSAYNEGFEKARSGNLIEYDDTLGNEKYTEGIKTTGTSYEVHRDGTQTR